jgi:hypothetical protein
MSPVQLLDLLTGLFPEFRDVWDDEDNNFYRTGDDFTAHGFCAEFSHFYIECGATANPGALAKLFQVIEEQIVADPNDQDPVANAVCTCFLENIAQLPAGERSIPFMGPESRKFFAHWHFER